MGRNRAETRGERSLDEMRQNERKQDEESVNEMRGNEDVGKLEKRTGDKVG